MSGKEYSDYRLFQEQIKHLRELRELDQRALELQRTENDRRLNNLNGEHENIKQNQAKSVLREVYDSQQDEQNDKIQTLLAWKSNSEGRQAMSKWIAIIAVIIAAISLILGIIRTFKS